MKKRITFTLELVEDVEEDYQLIDAMYEWITCSVDRSDVINNSYIENLEEEKSE